MSIRDPWKGARQNNQDTVKVSGRLVIGGTGAVSSVVGQSINADLTNATKRTAQGIYQLTFDRKWQGLVTAKFGMKSATNLDVQLTSVANLQSDGYVTFTVFDSGGETATDPTSGDWIMFEFELDPLGRVT